MRFIVVILAFCFFLMACQTSNHMVLSGTIGLGASISSADVQVHNVILGAFLVKFRNNLRVQNQLALQWNQNPIRFQRQLGQSGIGVFQAQRTMSLQDVQQAINTLRLRHDIEYIEPDRMVVPLTNPNDPLFEAQWNLASRNQAIGGARLPLNFADDATQKRLASQVIAVVDTGILFSASDETRTHPELKDRVLPGFDFITDETTANDGDARDAEPFDPGDRLGQQGSYHGSMVASIAAAQSNNGIGLSGVSAAKILPIRALGIQGGRLSDVLDGVLWASGEFISGTPLNLYPADVINLSLGSKNSCSKSEEEVYARILGRPQKPVIVAAAGNNSSNVIATAPAGCSGVLAIGATNRSGQRAPYSNFGSSITIMAPGGQNGAGSSEAIYGITWKDDIKTFDYKLDAGTSFAAPLVAGVITHMKAAVEKPRDLSASQIKQILQDTAVPMTATQCNRLTPLDCGAGLIDAQAAIQVAGGQIIERPDFRVSIRQSDFILRPNQQITIQVNVIRSGGFDKPVRLSIIPPFQQIQSEFSTASTTESSVSLTLKALNTISDGQVISNIQAVDPDGVVRIAPISVQLQTKPSATLDQTHIVAIQWGDDTIEDKAFLATQVKLDSIQTTWQSSYSMTVPIGTYALIAFKDTDKNNIIGIDDYFGMVAFSGTLDQISNTQSNLDFDVQRIENNNFLGELNLSFPVQQKISVILDNFFGK